MGLIPMMAMADMLRLLVLFWAGATAGSCINLGVYRLAWRQRSLSPWSAPSAGALPRRWTDRIPIFGWLALRRETPLHGRGFWIRPLLVELVTGLLLAGLYDLEIGSHPARVWMSGAVAPAAHFLSGNLGWVLHAQYLSHVILICLMLTASLIDIDEKTIPDAITVPGTLIGLALAACYPWSLLPAGFWMVQELPQVEFLTFVSPQEWPAGLDGLPLGKGLAVALGCWSLWCVGLMPRRWTLRRGWRMALRIFVHRLRVEAMTYAMLLLWFLGAAAIALFSALAGEAHWVGLLTALVGMAAGGGLVWFVRIVGTAALRREAMGFGDVTLLAMIGTFVGWQGALLVFFLAPFAGLVIGLTQWIFHGEHEIPYGPFLCMAALGVVVKWAAVWEWGLGIFQMGELVPLLMAGCLGLMGGMLWIYRIVRDLLMGSAS